MKLASKRIRLFQRQGYKFQGLVTDEDENFLWLEDEVKHRPFMIRKDSIDSLEVLDA